MNRIRLMRPSITSLADQDIEPDAVRPAVTAASLKQEDSADSPGAAAVSISPPPVHRRSFLAGFAAGAASLALPRPGRSASRDLDAGDLDAIRRQVSSKHDETVRRLQEWIHQPSIAAENKGVAEGCDLTMRLLTDAGFGKVTKVPTDGQPGIFAILDAGASRTVGVYFMYDVKQVDPAEWSSPPWDAAIVDKPGLGKVMIGRGAVNQKGPEATFIAALHAIRGAGRKLPVNMVLVAEG